MSFLKGIYAVAIGVLIVLLVIIGVEAFYSSPPPFTRDLWDPRLWPSYCPEETDPADLERELTRRMEEYREQRALYYTNVFLVVLPLGALMAVGGTLARRRLDTLGAGFILGGVGTMIYAVVPSALDSVLRFVGIAVALAVLVFVGFRVLASARHG